MIRSACVITFLWSASTAHQCVAAQILWLDASDDSKVTESSGIVSAWQNKAPGFANSLTSSGSQQPTRIAGPNGTKVIDFDGAADRLRDTAFGQSASDVTVFLVVAPDSNAGSYRGFFSARSSSGNDYDSGLTIDQTNSSTSSFSTVNIEGPKSHDAGGVDFYSGSVSFGTYHILQVNYNTTKRELLFDGVVNSSLGHNFNNALPVSLAEVRVGVRHYSGSEQAGTALDGKVAEVIVYNSALTSTEANVVGYYLEQKYGLTTAYVPEPGGLMMASMGLVALVSCRGRRLSQPW